MTYGSIAGGARGIIYYNFNWDRAETLADQWCNPLNNLLEEISRLGELLIPIGRRLLLKRRRPIAIGQDEWDNTPYGGLGQE